jgi:hypothetical protein
MLVTEIPTYPTRKFKPSPDKIVVANFYDVKKASVRNNKEELFKELINLTLRHTSNEINRKGETIASFQEGLTPPGDSSVTSLMAQHQASHAIFIKSFDSYFDQTEVVVTQTEGGKNREAHYDIIVDIRYSIYRQNKHWFDTLISVRKYHSSRSVLSGLLAAGPNIVANSSDAMEGIYANVDAHLKTYFKSYEKRQRNLLISKSFKAMKYAMDAGDFELALSESEKLISSDKKMESAAAALNCAILLEYLGRPEKIKSYLETSLATYWLQDADIMMMDYAPNRTRLPMSFLRNE